MAVRNCMNANCEMTTSGWCPRCDRSFTPGIMPPVWWTLPPGCICPPTSEQTCGNPLCPRKSPEPK